MLDTRPDLDTQITSGDSILFKHAAKFVQILFTMHWHTDLIAYSALCWEACSSIGRNLISIELCSVYIYSSVRGMQLPCILHLYLLHLVPQCQYGSWPKHRLGTMLGIARPNCETCDHKTWTSFDFALPRSLSLSVFQPQYADICTCM